MNTNKYILRSFAFVLFCFCILALSAQQNYLEQISIENMSINKRSGATIVTLDMNLDGLKIDRNHLLKITPGVHSADGQKSIELSPVYVIGSTRNRVLNRPFTWDGKTEIDSEALISIVRQNGTGQLIRYSDMLPFEEWNREAQLWLIAEVIGCADCEVRTEKININNRILPPAFVPDYRMTLTEPEPEIPKRRSAQYSALLNYQVGRHELLPNFGNNALELAKIDRSINDLRSDDNLTITDFTISGYASPEGTKESNLLLSQRRAETFARYIEQGYGYTRDQFRVEWFGEDWDGLRRAVEASSLPNKTAILNIIDTEPDFDARDAKLIALDNGQTYNLLLREFYPPLRRNDYNIAFISRPFTTGEAGEVIKTQPQYLNLKEMWDVAATLPEDSDEYKQVFDIAADIFPNEAVANLNAATIELRRNNSDAAIARLQKVTESSAKSLNLWGIVYVQRNDPERAKTNFLRAVQSGSTEAQYNLEQLEKYIEDNL